MPRMAIFLIAIFLTTLASAQIPKPADVIGFEPGSDYKLAKWGQLIEYTGLSTPRAIASSCVR